MNMKFIKAKTYSELSDQDKMILENFLGHTKFESIRETSHLFNDTQSFKWIRENGHLPQKMKLILIGYYLSTKPVTLMNALDEYDV